ncbi:unnamed protein product [Closterium sp. NIES-54]
MYYPYRQDASVKEQSMLNTSTPAVLDSGNSSRQFASSFAAPQTQAANPGAFHHGGNLQSLHNVQATGYSIQSMQNALTRGTGMGGVPSAQSQPPSAGNMAAGRFSTSALPTNLQQVRQGEWGKEVVRKVEEERGGECGEDKFGLLRGF